MSGRYENVDGHRVWTPVAPGDAPSLPETPSTPAPDQQGGAGALPPFAVVADYRTNMVALLFDPEHIPALAAHPLFQSEARLLHGAATDCELWIEEQIRNDRDRQLMGGQR
jgi:hypothetical protein